MIQIHNLRQIKNRHRQETERHQAEREDWRGESELPGDERDEISLLGKQIGDEHQC